MKACKWCIHAVNAYYGHIISLVRDFLQLVCNFSIYRDPDYESVKNFSMSDVYDDILPSPVNSDSFDMSLCPVYERQSSETTLSLVSDGFEMTVSPLYSPAKQLGGLAMLPVMGAPADLARAFQIQPNTQHEQDVFTYCNFKCTYTHYITLELCYVVHIILCTLYTHNYIPSINLRLVSPHQLNHSPY